MTVGGKSAKGDVFLAHEIDLFEFCLNHCGEERYFFESALEEDGFPKVVIMPDIVFNEF